MCKRRTDPDDQSAFAQIPRRMPVAMRRSARFLRPASAFDAGAGPVSLNEHVFCYFYGGLFRYSALTEVFGPSFTALCHIAFVVDFGYPGNRTKFEGEI
jgi:hypothetical protein